MPRGPRMRWAVAASLVALTVTACGGGADGQPPEETSPSSSSPSSSASPSDDGATESGLPAFLSPTGVDLTGDLVDASALSVVLMVGTEDGSAYQGFSPEGSQQWSIPRAPNAPTEYASIEWADIFVARGAVINDQSAPIAAIGLPYGDPLAASGPNHPDLPRYSELLEVRRDGWAFSADELWDGVVTGEFAYIFGGGDQDFVVRAQPAAPSQPYEITSLATGLSSPIACEDFDPSTGGNVVANTGRFAVIDGDVLVDSQELSTTCLDMSAGEADELEVVDVSDDGTTLFAERTKMGGLRTLTLFDPQGNVIQQSGEFNLEVGSARFVDSERLALDMLSGDQPQTKIVTISG